MKKVQHIEHAYECKNCKGEAFQKAQIKLGTAPQASIQRSIVSSSVVSKVMNDKFLQYFPLCRKEKEWERYGFHTNDKKLSNWIIRASHDGYS